MNKQQAKAEVERLLDEHFPKGFHISVSFKSRVKRYYGFCRVNLQDRNAAEIWYANAMFEHCTPEHILNTVRHEVAHALAWHRNGTIRHDRAWKLACIEVGCNGRVGTPAPDNYYRYIIRCSLCGRKFNRFHRMTDKKRILALKGGCPDCRDSFGFLEVYDQRERKVVLQGLQLTKQRRAA